MPTLLHPFLTVAARPEASGVIISLALLLSALVLFKRLAPWRAHLRPRRILTAVPIVEGLTQRPTNRDAGLAP